ncbi:MAG: isomerase [Methylibium sp. NZG]|nr:MAG: isomerase [Methylibium sp. NZG]
MTEAPATDAAAAHPPRCDDARVARIVAWFEAITPAALGQLDAIYHPQARFKDPFNEVQGLAPIRRVFEHMFVALDEPRFVVRDIVVQRDQCFLSWEFIFRFKRFSREVQTVRGGSHLALDAAGLITLHRDYWDAAEELYEKLPAVGPLMRWLKKRANS